MSKRPSLLAELARVLRLADPMPPRVLADAEAAGVLAVERLEVLVDTLAAARCAGRRLRLGRPGEDPVLELEIRRVGPAVRLAGLAPPGALLTVCGTAVPVAGSGYFHAELPADRVRLLLTEPGHRPRATGWLHPD
jgi:hypothetical protein